MDQQIHQVFKQTAQLYIVQQVVQKTHPHIRPVDEVPVDAMDKSLGKDEMYGSQQNSLPDDASMMPRITCICPSPPSQNDLLQSEHHENLLARELQPRNTHPVAEEFPKSIIAHEGCQTRLCCMFAMTSARGHVRSPCPLSGHPPSSCR